MGKESYVKKLRREMRKQWRNSPPVHRRAIVEYLSPEQKVARLLELFEEYYDNSNKSSVAPGAILKRIRKHHSGLLLPGRDAGIEGHVPGVEVGRRFNFRAVLSLLGLHRRTQAGIDYREIILPNRDTALIALSVVVSGGYEDNVDEGETLIYTGEGGHKTGSKKQVEDQKLQRGNEALRNNKGLTKPVRVIRAYGKRVYSYDGLYRVTGYEIVPGKSKFKVFKFKLVREPSQKPLCWSPTNVATGEAGRRFASSGRKRERWESSEDSLSSSSEESAETSESQENEFCFTKGDWLTNTGDGFLEGKDLTSLSKKSKSAEVERDGYDVQDVDNETMDKDGSDDEYEVECITDKRTVGRGTKKRTEFRVHWRGYTREEDTWEPESNLANCPEKLAQFRRVSE